MAARTPSRRTQVLLILAAAVVALGTTAFLVWHGGPGRQTPACEEYRRLLQPADGASRGGGVGKVATERVRSAAEACEAS